MRCLCGTFTPADTACVSSAEEAAAKAPMMGKNGGTLMLKKGRKRQGGKRPELTEVSVVGLGEAGRSVLRGKELAGLLVDAKHNRALQYAFQRRWHKTLK